METVKVLVNSSSAIPISDDPIIMWPVDDIGRNSVIPSMMPSMMASQVVIGDD
jgi:hypothetical protein